MSTASAASPPPARPDDPEPPGVERALRPRPADGLAPVVRLPGRAEPRAPRRGRVDAAEDEHPTPPRAFASTLAMHAVEVVDGTRSVSQLRGHITGAVAEQLIMQRRARAERRAVHGDDRRVVPAPGSVFYSRPRADVVEAAVTVRLGTRTRATALRLEHLRGRWRATSLTVL